MCSPSKYEVCDATEVPEEGASFTSRWEPLLQEHEHQPIDSASVARHHCGLLPNDQRQAFRKAIGGRNISSSL
eukprot:12937179-Prorocentrum_lima.AAC.1